MAPRLALIGFGVAAVVVASGGSALGATAQHHPKPRPTAFAVAPTRSEVKPGSGALIVRVQNTGTKRVLMSGTMARLIQHRDGSFTTAPAGKESAAQWLTIKPSVFTVKPGHTRQVRILMRLPKSATGTGQHYLAAVFRPVTSGATKKTGATVSPGIASEIILDTRGPSVHKTAFDLQAPHWSTGGPIRLTATIKNSGNAYGLFNGLSAKAGGTTVPFPGVLVLGGSTRTVSALWASPPLFCVPCHVTLAGATATVWRAPLLPLLGVVLILIALVLLIVWRGRAHRRITTAPGPDSLDVLIHEHGIPDAREHQEGQGFFPAPWIEDVTRDPRTGRGGNGGGPIAG